MCDEDLYLASDYDDVPCIPSKIENTPKKDSISISEHIVYNTLGDIHDEPRQGFTLGSNEPYIENSNQIIHEIKGNFLNTGELEIPARYGGGVTNNYHLSEFLDKLPHGIFNKQITGIGATTIEITSKRNSIIVVPTRILALNKSTKHPNCLYIGGNYKGQGKVTPIEDIELYLQDCEFSKFIVVADSLTMLISTLINDLGIDVYNEYFFMIDEIDLFQEDSNYRPILETPIDYYFKFNVKNRCLVSATLKDFSNPLFKNECVFSVSDVKKQKRELTIMQTFNIAQKLIEIISSTKDDKILIAYNVVVDALKIIEQLDDELKNECAILCSQSNKSTAQNYYSELPPNNKLPNRIVFMTCTYFAGIDIEDSYHLVTISNARNPYQILSLEKIIQIHGRCRVKDGILSDKLILLPPNTQKKVIDKIQYQQSLIDKAQKVLDLYTAADNISHGDPELSDLFSNIKPIIAEKAIESLRGSTSGLPLTRQNVDQGYSIAFFNIDHLVEKRTLFYDMYLNEEVLLRKLSTANISVTEYIIDTINEELPPLKSSISEEEKEKERSIEDEELKIIIKKIKSWDLDINSLSYNNELYAIQRGKSKKSKEFIRRFMYLKEYLQVDELLENVWNIRHASATSFKNLNNALVFWSLDDSHPYKIDVLTTFKIGKKFTSQEILDEVNRINKYHNFKRELDEIPATRFLNRLLLTERDNDRVAREIIRENPYNFKKHNIRISKDKRLLNSYFLF